MRDVNSVCVGILTGILVLVGACSGGKPSEDAAASNSDTVAGQESVVQALSSNEYPAELIGKYADRECEEAKAIEQAAGIWSGFEIKQYEKVEQAVTCAPVGVALDGESYKIAEQCLVAGVGQQLSRESMYKVSEGVLSVTLDGKAASYQSCTAQ